MAPTSDRDTGNTVPRQFRGVVLPPGPWHDEGDHEDFRSPEDVPCIIHRNRVGAWCGYVAVPPGHPWHGANYTEVPAEVHGGLTYSDGCNGEICHVPSHGESDDVWWLGFDCCHSGDMTFYDLVDGRIWAGVYKTADYARAETLRLAAQAHTAL
jgi:hypothetical protein